MDIPESFFDVSFNKAMAFGYKTEDVDEFVTKALRLVKELQEENEVLQEKMAVLATSLEKYREEEDSLHVHAEYLLDMNGQQISRCRIALEVRSRAMASQ